MPKAAQKSGKLFMHKHQHLTCGRQSAKLVDILNYAVFTHSQVIYHIKVKMKKGASV